MINFDDLDFSEWHSEEVISLFWRSVYVIFRDTCVRDSSRDRDTPRIAIPEKKEVSRHHTACREQWISRRLK